MQTRCSALTIRWKSAKPGLEVNAATVQVETTDTHVGDVVGGGTIQTLPLSGGNFTDVLGPQPGVVPVSTGAVGNNEAGNVSISGQRGTANGFEVNGGMVEEAQNDGTANRYVMLLRFADRIWGTEGLYISFNPKIEDVNGGTVPEKFMARGEAILANPKQKGNGWYVQAMGTEKGETDNLADRSPRVFVDGSSGLELVVSRRG
jgi:hypothetical protein